MLRVMLYFVGVVSGGGFCLLFFHLGLWTFGYNDAASTLNWNFIDGLLYGLFGSPIGMWMIRTVAPANTVNLG